MRKVIRDFIPLSIVLAIYLALGVAYSLVVPPFEAPDEVFHHAFARQIAQGGGLPVQDPHQSGPWAQEGSQAPLYYLLVGTLTRGIDQRDFDALIRPNPRANIGDPLEPGNKNVMLYSGYPPALINTNLALHLGRWFSLLLGMLTITCTFLTARFVFPGRGDLPLIAAALVAAIPQFLFITAAVTNDALVIAASAATIYWLARLLARSDAAPIRAWEWIVLGGLLGVAALSKLQGLGLMPLAGGVALFLAWQRRSGRLLVAAALGTGLTVLLIAGWWYVRNIQLYGDWSGLEHLKTINGRRASALTLANFWPEFRGLRFSFWGLFGWFSILLPGWFYTLMDLLSVAGAAGLVGALVGMVRATPAPQWQSRPLRVIVLLGTWAILMALLLAYWVSQAVGSQGRLIFPGLIAFAILLVCGLDFWLHWLPKAAQRLSWAALFAVLLGISVYALVWLLPASYAAPAPVSALPATATPTDLLFGADEPIRLLGLEVGQGRYEPGERVPVTLYWQSAQPLTHDYQLFVQFLDEAGKEVANLTGHPGWGRNPTSRWTPGAIYADRYAVLVQGPVAAWSPLAARVYVGWVDPATEQGEKLPLPVQTTTGEPGVPFVAKVLLQSGTPLEPAALNLQAAGATFGNVIQLGGVAAPAELQVGATGAFTTTLLLAALGQPATDYVAYVHLRNAAGERVAGFDQAPAGERFPTHFWQPGDRVLSELPVDLPTELAPGVYELWVGLYEAGSGGAVRLPVTEAGGLKAGDGEVRIGEVRVE